MAARCTVKLPCHWMQRKSLLSSAESDAMNRVSHVLFTVWVFVVGTDTEAVTQMMFCSGGFNDVKSPDKLRGRVVWQWVRPPAAGGHCVLGTDLCHRDGEEEQKREQNSPWLKARYCICTWKHVHMLVILLPKLLSNRKIEFRRRQRRDFLLRLFGKVLEQKQHCSQSRTLSTEARDQWLVTRVLLVLSLQFEKKITL